MRAFEFQAGEVLDNESLTKVMIVDLDAIVRLGDTFGGMEKLAKYYVAFSDGCSLRVTKAAFDRILLAWKSG
jgi:hypothetical protein